MRFHLRLPIFLILGLVFPILVHGQAEISPTPMPDLPRFYFDALSFASEQSGISRLDVYIEVPHEVLRFVKDGDVFRAKYEVTVDLYDSTDKLIDEKWWTEDVETTNYDETVSPTASRLSNKTFLLEPREYSVVVQIKDTETEKVSRLRRVVHVRDYFSPPFIISDLMLVSHVDTTGGTKTIYPNISGNVGDLREGVSLFFEVYNHVDADSAQVTVSVHNVKGDVVQSDSFVQPLGVHRKPCFHLEKTAQLIAGDYILELRAVPLGTMGSDERLKDVSTVTSRSFVIRWHGVPTTITDLDTAIDQLMYITDKDRIDDMKKLPMDKKKEAFQAFWNKRDPTPNTERNELMEEYYARVNYANKHFTHYIEGWKSDMGMVYIVFGAPNNIDRHPFEIDSKPYEVWTYYEINREFVFVDQTGFGDYRLENPAWDVFRTRIR